MIDEVAMVLAMRARAATLSVATTGLVSLSATATGYARVASTGTVSAVAGAATFSASQSGALADGSKIVVAGVTYTLSGFNGTTGGTLTPAATFGASAFTMGFQAENFWPGMEITPAGFATNTVRVITAVTALAITVSGSVTPEVAAGSRSLTVGLPSQRAWENVAFEPTPGVPWVEEHFVSGPARQISLGPLGEIEVEPMYALHMNLPSETGLTVRRYVNALRVLFAPRTAITLSNGDVLRVRSDTGPYPGDLQQGRPGFAVLPVTFPLRLRTSNSI